MSAESSLTAVAVVRALLNEDTEGLAVLLPDGLPEPGRRGQLADRDPRGAGRDQRPCPFPLGLLQPPCGPADTRQDSPLPPARLDPLTDRHRPSRQPRSENWTP